MCDLLLYFKKFKILVMGGYMKRTRREFMKEAVCLSTVVATGTAAQMNPKEAVAGEQTGQTAKCPYFDQPLMCGGPDENGVYKCDA